MLELSHVSLTPLTGPDSRSRACPVGVRPACARILQPVCGQRAGLQGPAGMEAGIPAVPRPETRFLEVLVQLSPCSCPPCLALPPPPCLALPNPCLSPHLYGICQQPLLPRHSHSFLKVWVPVSLSCTAVPVPVPAPTPLPPTPCLALPNPCLSPICTGSVSTPHPSSPTQLPEGAGSAGFSFSSTANYLSTVKLGSSDFR
uniref:Uncharacterized protein n=1 Tax=Branchiostoma floridae TaxID=7739 RepID=C3ZTZ6_BRAFL|eukprot:XP_002587871.1 hypothetical protein BRAFLDRAFT_87258 [Branchiostoma floridae]